MKDQVRKILVVEDEVELREIIVSILRAQHHHVYEAENGMQALDLMKQHLFALVLTDIKMPFMDGLQFFIEAKAMGMQMPFVFVTAYGDQDNIMHALRLGAFDFIPKPFDETEMNLIVDRAVEVGYRRQQILKTMTSLDPEKVIEFQKHDHIIQLLEIKNNKKKA